MDARSFSFGPFVLIPQQQVLLRDNVPVHLGVRALDLLTQFVRRAGEVLEKRELMTLVWADTFVDESNLKVTVAAIRRVLDTSESGRSCIATVIGRGYRFVETVRVNRLAEPETPGTEHCGVPTTYGYFIGRDVFLSQLTDQMSAHRFVTLVVLQAPVRLRLPPLQSGELGNADRNLESVLDEDSVDQSNFFKAKLESRYAASI
jgi:DNA-binding winged helix-turn-helix (wHTH) protein